MGNDQKFLPLVPDYMSLQTLISNSFSPAYTIKVHWEKSPSVVTFQYCHWCQCLEDNSYLLSKRFPRCRPQLSRSQVALCTLGSSLCWIQTAMKRRFSFLSGLHLIPRSSTLQAIFSCLLLFLPAAQRHQTRPIVHWLGQGAMSKANPKSFISSASLSDTFLTSTHYFQVTP